VSTGRLLLAQSHGHCRSELASIGLGHELIIETIKKMRDEEG